MEDIFIVASISMVLMWAQIIFFERKKAGLTLKKHLPELKLSVMLMVAAMVLFLFEEILSLFGYGKIIKVLQVTYFSLLIVESLVFFKTVMRDG